MDGIVKALLSDITTDKQVKEAMDGINASKSEKVAAQFAGDAQRILIVDRAKAVEQSKRLQGKGIAGQHEETARGLGI